jgi:hypothetical protein
MFTSRLTRASLQIVLSPTLLLLAAAGCDDGGTSTPVSGAAAGLAILSSNYQLTSVSVYDPKTAKLTDDCVPPAELSKDTALPSGTQHGELVVIDRENSKIKLFDPATCMKRAELSVSTGGFKAYPHDVVYLSPTKSYVTRYETNAAPTADPNDFDEGEDLLVVDVSVSAEPKIVKRIPLTASAATLQARPDRAILAGDKVYVTLNNLAADFSAAGPGRVAIVDPATDTVTGTIDLPDQTDCSGLEYAAATKKLYVTCGGAFSDADQAAKSALVEIDLSTATPAVARTIQAKALGARPIGYQQTAVVGDQAYVGTMGELDLTTGAMLSSDSFYVAALAGGAPTKILDGGAFNLGRPAADATTKLLYLPDGDATTPRVRIIDLSGATPTAGTPFEPNPAGHLPPREAAWF